MSEFFNWTSVITGVVVVGSAGGGALAWLVLYRLSPETAEQHYFSRRGIVSFGATGAFGGALSAAISLAFWLLFQERPNPFKITIHLVFITVAGILGMYLGLWLAVRVLRRRRDNS